jgi:hypothetical protein
MTIYLPAFPTTAISKMYGTWGHVSARRRVGVGFDASHRVTNGLWTARRMDPSRENLDCEGMEERNSKEEAVVQKKEEEEFSFVARTLRKAHVLI